MPDNMYSARANHVSALVAMFVLPLIVFYWLTSVSQRVLEPYLDEFFHVGQAQTYCAGNLLEWDDKITTPPGLYILSYLVYQLSGSCDITALRSLNAVLLLFIFLVVLYMNSPSTSQAIMSRPSSRSSSLLFGILKTDPQQLHTALNICLFPPLFFFSGLYYTDVASTLFVLLHFKHFFDMHTAGIPTIVQAMSSVLLGLAALSFRQTNIFWVAVFPAALVAVGAVTDTREASRSKITRDYTVSGALRDVVTRSWEDGVLYEPQVGGAWIDDYLMNIVSICVLAVRTLTKPEKLLRLIRLLLPSIILLILFGTFVLWNGGVVLGDKSNHIATIHLPQMLYIWPYITFFSLPQTYPCLLQGGLALLGMIPVVAILEPLLVFSRHRVLPRPIVTLACVGLATLVVHYNTIVHPFTLADNRHYTFYVFRLLLRYPIARYAAAPVYLVSAWSVIQALGASGKMYFTDQERTRGVAEQPPLTSTKASSSSSSVGKKSGEENDKSQIILLNSASLSEGCTVSFVLVWLLTSTLALVTAPLVEPRYFILPWIMWRLRVPQATIPVPGLKPDDSAGDVTRSAHGNTSGRGKRGQTEERRKKEGWWNRLVNWARHDHRLWLETAWLLVVNAATGWVFLNWGFEWAQEPGRVQRFMWRIALWAAVGHVWFAYCEWIAKLENEGRWEKVRREKS